ncbi:MAG TPA: sodium:proton antiporter [Ramlibacter sp.]|jgi:CPA1 family monovalent cation:H+ antiporter|nr:sodium:proton antiporter [Ramlibacter sp.]
MTLLELVGVLAAVVAVLGFINHRFIRLPEIIGITAAGAVVALLLALVGRHVPAVVDWAKAFAAHIDFSALVFDGLLGVLLFAGSLHVHIADLAKQKWPVLVLATIGVALSTVLVGYGAYALLAVMGLPVPLKYCLLFGALISPTDPIAVLGVLKTVGAPKPIEMDIAGESLFNDGTGVVAYLFLLGIATGASEPSWSGIAKLVALEIGGALVLGFAVGYIAFAMLKGLDSYAVEILVTIALATGGYALAQRLHVSGPLAVVVMGLVIGNHAAKSAMSETTRRNLFQFWELVDEILNLMLFGMIGLMLVALTDLGRSWWLAIAMVPVVLLARLASVAGPALLLRPFVRHRTPHAVKVLTWGGLRGGLSVALALSLPSFEERELFVMATYCVVLFSLLVQAPTLGLLLRRLGVVKKRPRPSPG